MYQAWLASSLQRIYPSTMPSARPFADLAVVRGQRASVQAAVRTGDRAVSVAASVETSSGISARLRRVGHVPVRHHTTGVPSGDLEGLGLVPGLVPDPLFGECALEAGPWESHSFWVSLEVPEDLAPGDYSVEIVLSVGNETSRLIVRLHVSAAVLPPRTGFPVTHWLHADALADWYRVKTFEEPFWQVLRNYLDDYVAHGSDLIYVPLFTPPLDGDRRPMQLLGVQHRCSGEYQFDWTLVRRWVHECIERGVAAFEWTHLFSQWGAAHPPVIYEGHGESRRTLWGPDTTATSPAYTEFLSVLLPELERFLTIEDLLRRSYFHLSDEPAGDEALGRYREARGLIRRLAPWMTVIDALSDIRFADEGMVDEPVALLPEATRFVQHGLPTWAYFCCLPRGRYLNRFLDTPLTTIAMSGWLFHSVGVKGFLHWGFNYWYRAQTSDLIDPYVVTDGDNWPEWPAGDPCQVYPGPSGPVDSIRWEIFAESLQDLAMLRSLPPNPTLLADVHGFDDFPRAEPWISGARAAVADLIARDQRDA